MRVILSGGGSGEKTKEIDRLFVSLLDKKKPLLYLPFAIDNIKHPYPDCLKWLKSTFEDLGIKKYEMWVEKDLDKSSKLSPNSFSGIYIGGGNTPYLLKKLKETDMWTFLKKVLEENVPIYGGSAGAAIFSKTILYSLYADKNWVDLKNLGGMNILGDREITCHYDETQKAKIIKISEENQGIVFALSERNGLYITNKETRVIGQEPITLFKDGKIIKIIKPGDKI
jgi:dipeptidase E